MRLSYCVLALLFAAKSLAAQSPETKASSAQVKVGDVVRITIWREPELGGDFLVPESGTIAFPKIGNWQVANRPVSDLKAELLEEYLKYLRNPSIEIRFLRRVSVLGAVNRPGVYALDETMMVAHALANAGGVLPEGKQNEVQLFRDGKKLVTNITQGTLLSALPLQSGDQLLVPERSWLDRNAGLVAAMVSGAVSVAVTLIVNSN